MTLICVQQARINKEFNFTINVAINVPIAITVLAQIDKADAHCILCNLFLKMSQLHPQTRQHRIARGRERSE